MYSYIISEFTLPYQDVALPSTFTPLATHLGNRKDSYVMKKNCEL